jgi:hypothetical protein
MKKRKTPYWFRFVFFAVIFLIAFIFIVFLFNRNMFDNIKTLILKIGVIAMASSLLFNFLLESDPEM